MDLEEQYDKIYRYCYFKLRNRETAEDITQETFLRYFDKYGEAFMQQPLRCLYTIARHLCIDEYKRLPVEPLQESLCEHSGEEQMVTSLAVRAALSKLDRDEQELLLLRHVNEESVSVIAEILGISRFAVYRRLLAAANKFKEELGSMVDDV